VTRPWDPEEAVVALARADRRLGRVIERLGPCGMGPPRHCDPFVYLLKAIVYQQLSGRAAAAIHGRVLALFPRRRPTATRLQALDDAALRRAGLSAAKLAALRDLAGKRRDGTVPSRDRLVGLSDQEILERLTAVRGVGPWTVQMLLMFSLGRPDILPDTDLGIRKGYAQAFGRGALPAPAEVRTRAERWRPWRSAASWYLWRAADGAATV
jgi:3-methyladenine DNA glycosylase/8-oxoguanine DNA glycosylase